MPRTPNYATLIMPRTCVASVETRPLKPRSMGVSISGVYCTSTCWQTVRGSQVCRSFKVLEDWSEVPSSPRGSCSSLDFLQPEPKTFSSSKVRTILTHPTRINGQLQACDQCAETQHTHTHTQTLSLCYTSTYPHPLPPPPTHTPSLSRPRSLWRATYTHESECVAERECAANRGDIPVPDGGRTAQTRGRTAPLPHTHTLPH